MKSYCIIKAIIDLLNLTIINNFLETDSENEDLSQNCVNVVNNAKLDDHNTPIKPFYALILTPTRELAVQIKNHLTQAAKYTDIKVIIVFVT